MISEFWRAVQETPLVLAERPLGPAITLLMAFLSGALVRSQADEKTIRRIGIERIVRALEALAKATQNVASYVREAGRACK